MQGGGGVGGGGAASYNVRRSAYIQRYMHTYLNTYKNKNTKSTCRRGIGDAEDEGSQSQKAKDKKQKTA